MTGGQTLLSVVTADRQTLIDQESVRSGSKLTFMARGHTYRLEVLDLRNFIIGDDFVVLTISRTTVPEV